jgi:hypothetical protein
MMASDLLMEPCSNCLSLCPFFVTEPKSSYGSAWRRERWRCGVAATPAPAEESRATSGGRHAARRHRLGQALWWRGAHPCAPPLPLMHLAGEDRAASPRRRRPCAPLPLIHRELRKHATCVALPWPGAEVACAAVDDGEEGGTSCQIWGRRGVAPTLDLGMERSDSGLDGRGTTCITRGGSHGRRRDEGRELRA